MNTESIFRLEKIGQSFYKLSEHSDEFMYVLHLFLNYGPFPATYIDFLKNSEKNDFRGNVVNLYKKIITLVLK